MSPLVSICIPTYNRADLLPQAIKSALAQTYSNVEILVVDDASTDNSVHFVKSITDKRLRLTVNKKNLGMVGNWNRCLALAKGEYIKFLNSDDSLKPSCIETMMKVVETEKVGFVGCNSEVINHDGIVIRLFEVTSQSKKYLGKDLAKTFMQHRVNNIGEPSSVLFKTSLIKKAGIFNPAYKQIVDVEYWIRLLRNTDAYLIKTPLCQFLTHPEAHSSQAARQGWPIDDAFLLIKEYGKDFGLDEKAYRLEIALSVQREVKQAVIRGDWKRAGVLMRRLWGNISFEEKIVFLVKHGQMSTSSWSKTWL